MRFLSLGVLVGGALALLSGCGGSSNSSLSYSAFSNAANKICQTVSSQGKAAGSVTDKANAANAAIVAKLLGIEQSGIGKLKGLKGPSALESARDTFVSDANQASTVAKSVADAAKAGDQSSYDSAIQRLVAADHTTNSDGSQLGAPACAQD